MEYLPIMIVLLCFLIISGIVMLTAIVLFFKRNTFKSTETNSDLVRRIEVLENEIRDMKNK